MEDKQYNYWISIILVTYNRYKFLKRAVQSVIDQTMKANWELVICDDGSDQIETRNYLDYDLPDWWADQRTLQECGLTVLKLPHSGWPSISRAQGVKYAMGEAICYLDDDNQYKPHHIQAMWEFLCTHPDIDAVYGSTELHHKDGRVTIRDQDFDVEEFRKCNYIDTGDVMHLAKCITPDINWDLGNQSHTVHEDIGLWEQFINAGYKFAHLKEVLSIYYFHDRQRTDQKNRHRIMASECPSIS